MKNFILVLGTFLLIIVSSCDSDKAYEPKLIHSEKELIHIIADMEFAEQMVNIQKSSNRDSLVNKLKFELEKIHDVNLEDVKKDILELQKSPEKYISVMDSVISRIGEFKKN